jgi:hypothetical protein
VRVTVRLTPRAASDRILGLAAEPEGGAVLKVGVTAVPEDGKANAALVALLAKTWKLPKSAIAIASGATDRRKLLHIGTADAEEAASLARRLEEWIRENA